MDANSYESIQDLMASFFKRMDSFEGKLQKASPSSNNEALAAEFAAFKSFVITALRSLQEQIQCLAKEADRQEMRNRRKILLLHGVPESPKEVVTEVIAKTVKEQLKQASFSVTDISRCHRMGRAGSAGKPRPILCKLRDVAVRDQIWTSKTGLKGSGVTLSEFLTRTRHSIFMAARQRFGVSKCWTRDGNVYVIGFDGTRHRVSCQNDLDGIPKEASITAAVKETASAKEAAVPAKTRRAAARK